MRTFALVVAAIVAFGTVVAGPMAPQAAADGELAGLVVVIDPGHGGRNDGGLSRQVPNGRGGTKDCGTTGTSTNAGYPEHVFTWEVANSFGRS